MKEYRVGVHQRYQEDGQYYNLAKLMGGFKKSCYGSLERARADLKKFIREHDAGGADYDLEVTAWYIEEREVSPWVRIDSK